MTYARYPRFPQPESPWSESIFVTALLRGRDKRPATVGCLPSHSPSKSGPLVPPGKEAAGAKAGRLTKPPPCGSDGLALERMREWQASLSAQVSEPSGSGPTGRIRASGSEPVRRRAGLRSTRRHRWSRGFGLGSFGQDRASARELRNGGPRASVHGLPGRPRLRPRILPLRTRSFGQGDAWRGPGLQVPDLPSGEPPGLRP